MRELLASSAETHAVPRANLASPARIDTVSDPARTLQYTVLNVTELVNNLSYSVIFTVLQVSGFWTKCVSIPSLIL